MNVLQVENLSKIYSDGEAKINALQNVSFEMQKGEFVMIVGESGSGKSTLMNCIGGLDVPTFGKVCIQGKDIFALNEKERTIFRRQNIGIVFQAFHLISELNVEQNISFPFLLD